MLKKIFAIVSLLCFSQIAWAYIPHARLILDRTTKNNGKGFYVIDLEVQFQEEPEVVATHETWLVQDGDDMFARIYSEDTSGKLSPAMILLYRAGTKYYMGSDNRIHQTRTPEDFTESFFHFRSFDGFARYLISHRMAPSQIMAKERIVSIKNYQRQSAPNVLLARVGSTVTFGLGYRNDPHVWIDEDRFVIQKILLPSGAQLLANDQEPSARGLMFPKDRTLTWKDKSVQIKTISIRWLGEKYTGKKLNPRTFATSEKLTGQLPTLPIVQDFYERFR